MHRHFASIVTSGRARIATLGLLAALSACGGGNDFLESLVKLLTARFVPSSVSAARSSAGSSQLEITCDRAGLDTTFGRLGVEIKLDPDKRLPAGISAELLGLPPDADGFSRTACNSPGSTDELRKATLPVRVSV